MIIYINEKNKNLENFREFLKSCYLSFIVNSDEEYKLKAHSQVWDNFCQLKAH